MKKSTCPPCCGIIVFNNDKTVLVSTDRGNFSFPKGKRHRNETDLETAWRELEEETGLTKDHVKLVDDYWLDEFSQKGNISVRYFVAELTKNIDEFKFDPKELSSVAWYSISDAIELEKFVDRRKKILLEAQSIRLPNGPLGP
jgi:8-oxo-dGTP pyrophosphatase MutT (NUDIX family)